ncbi:MAG TPA: aminoacyl--tRNA ligase-related protein [Candidatus Peribacteraceae bacterium]|nr:aminoacyl--tRNA ligase-related protein [Candidatus Peribacteraceae bacterium]
MLLSQLFTKTTKETQSDAASKNADLLTRAGCIHKTMAGVYSYLPLGLKVLKKIENIVREEMDRIGGQEILMSALAPRENWEKTGRWDHKVMEVLFHVPAANDTEYALNPTHEEIVTPIAAQYVRSYRDLPFAAYQIQTKFRNELRAKSGILRGREFLMKDLYSFHVSQEDLDRYYEVAQGAYARVFERIGLGAQTYLTYASGGTFSKYSHEYQVLLPNGEDNIYISVAAEKEGMKIAVNKEIYEPGVTTCPVTGGTEFREEKASEAGNIFKLGTKFSSAFDLSFTDADGQKKEVIMGCYGIGISRLMGIVAEAMSDDDGLIWPKSIAPFDVHIVPIAKKEDDAAFAKALELKDLLEKAGKSVLFDDRMDASVGFKLADADLLGMPMRIVVSPKTLEQQSIELTYRATGETEVVSFKKISNVL